MFGKLVLLLFEITNVIYEINWKGANWMVGTVIIIAVITHTSLIIVKNVQYLRTIYIGYEFLKIVV